MRTDAFRCDASSCRTRQLTAEVESLPPSALLVETSKLGVYLAEARQIPALLDEIGRLRERTFRAIGEGTGSELDLDRFDGHYLHLFVWDAARGQVAGAYRIAAPHRLPQRDLPRSLYTNTLFDYDREFLDQLGPSLELGRAFVTPEFQRCSRVLALLWQGIARALHLQGARCLFGAVSVSASYSRRSRGLIAAALLAHHRHEETSGLVRAREPFALEPGDYAAAAALADPRALSARVSELESDGSPLPMLVKRYLELGGKFAAWHVDRAFGDSLDGLLVLDLERANAARVALYSDKRSTALRTSSAVS
jgi:putative hemolysin